MKDMLGDPIIESVKASPMSTSEIDAHPDAARIWATITEMREFYAGKEKEAVEEVLREEYDDLYEKAENKVKDEYLEDFEKCQIVVIPNEVENLDGETSITPLFYIDGWLPEEFKKWFDAQLDGLSESMQEHWEF